MKRGEKKRLPPADHMHTSRAMKRITRIYRFLNRLAKYQNDTQIHDKKYTQINHGDDHLLMTNARVCV